MNNCTLIGRLTKDPEEKVFAVGDHKVVTFTLAVDRRAKEKTTDFIPCQAWNKTGEIILSYAKKGDQIGVVGSLEVRSYDKDGERRTAFSINVSNVDLLGGRKTETVPSPVPSPVPVPPLLSDYDIIGGGSDNDALLPFSIE
ncbi:MAG: single-stranded DNA-binding protein [Ruminococcus sp.]|nr:single-stranded DNA-binding protein [Ruminococcus sp.]